MSYYFQPEYKFSHHSLMRIKQRLNSHHLSDVELKHHCLKLIKQASQLFETTKDLYIQINDSNLHFVIDKKANLIKTLIPMSAGRLLGILNN